MNPVDKVTGAVARALNRPNATARSAAMWVPNPIDIIRGGTIEDAVRNRVVMITGASSGIGASTAKKIGAAGGDVILVARTKEKLDVIAEEIRAGGGRAHVYPCDLSDTTAIAEMTDLVLADLGRVDVLINNAGRSIRRSLALSYDRLHDYQRTMALNYFGPVQLMLKLLPGMRQRRYGHIVNISSIGVQTRVPRFGAYIASKAALDILCDSWQGETNDDNVKFTTVHMPLVRTPMIEATTIYQKFPTLTPDDAAAVICETLIHRPRRASPPFCQIAAFADAITPQIMDRVRNAGYKMFGDSKAARVRSARRRRRSRRPAAPSQS